VLWILQTPRMAMRLLGNAFRIAEHAGHVANHRVDQHHRRHFAAVADEVADGNLPRLQAKPNALVKTLVTPTEQQQPFVGRQLLDDRLRQPLSGRGQQDEQARVRGLRSYRFDRVEHRLWHDYHARPAAERPIVHLVVLVLGPIADVPEVDFHQATVQRQLEQALGQVALEDFWEQGKDIEAHDLTPGESASLPAQLPPPPELRTWPCTS